MAGIYIHIPFCKQACSYCDFHFSTNLKNSTAVVEAICQELDFRKGYLRGEKIESIYFGGGTPSLLEKKDLEKILNTIHNFYTLGSNPEICLEANPDDLTQTKLKEISKAGINRLSIGVQSFHDEDLRFMNRAHNSKEAISSIKQAQDIGISNISIDLIFGSPSTTNKMWEQNLDQFFELNVPHLSSYSLTVEEKTKLAYLIKTNKVEALDDQKNYDQYLALQQAIDQNDFEQYELSNYCKNAQYSKHNSSYWLQKKYLGVGPSAHSYNGKSRQWNVSNNSLYLRAVNTKSSYSEKEELSEADQYHDYLITRLRTKWGVSKTEISSLFSDFIVSHFINQSNLIASKKVTRTDDSIIIKREFLFQSDQLVDLLWLDNVV